jgi:hypothetical protein
LPLTVVALDEPQSSGRRTRLLPNPDEQAHSVKASSHEVYAVRELVRINHLRNCLLCHAGSSSPNDPVRGPVPSPGQPLGTPHYSGGQNDIFVRADVTYIRQDFSVLQRTDTCPAHQRYDYVVRTRYPAEEELSRPKPATCPQREAVRWALRELAAAKGG